MNNKQMDKNTNNEQIQFNNNTWLEKLIEFIV